MCAFQPSPADAGEKPRHTKNQCFIQFFFLPSDLKGSFVLQHLFCMSRSMFANFFVVVFNQIYANVKKGNNHRISLLFLQLTNETVLLEHFFPLSIEYSLFFFRCHSPITWEKEKREKNTFVSNTKSVRMFILVF